MYNEDCSHTLDEWNSRCVGNEAIKKGEEDRRPAMEPDDLISDFSGMRLRETEHAVNSQQHSGHVNTEPMETQEEWEMEHSALVLERKLGDGSFGEVWKGKWRNVMDVAIKRMKTGSMSVKAFRDEAQIVKSYQHKHLVCLFGICSKEEPIYIVTELMTNGSLLEYLRKGAGHTASVAVLNDMARQVASGMAFLEENCLIHRDLAARNVLVGDNNVVKVADFGLARALAEGNSAYMPNNPNSPFPFKWTAPEAALLSVFTIKSDVWSYGILLHELMTRGQHPYPSMMNHEVLKQVQYGYRMARAEECPEPVYDVMLKCWDLDSNERPTFKWLHGFFDDCLDSEQRRNSQAQKLQHQTAEKQIVMGDVFSRDSSPDQPMTSRPPRHSSSDQPMAARPPRDSSPDERMAVRPPRDSSPDERMAVRSPRHSSSDQPMAARPPRHSRPHQPMAAKPPTMENPRRDLDAEAYRDGYPGKIDDPNAKDNLEFYTNRMKSKPKGDFIDNIHKNWKGNYKLLENHHGYIQWLFPLPEPGMNQHAQELQLHEALAIKKDKQARGRVLKSYELMLDFYGMRLKNRETGEIERAENWEDRFAHLNRSSHNHLRITRILSSLGHLGFEHFQYPLVEFVLKEALVEKTLVACAESCFNYWMGTMKNDKEREKLVEKLFDENAKKSQAPGCEKLVEKLFDENAKKSGCTIF